MWLERLSATTGVLGVVVFVNRRVLTVHRLADPAALLTLFSFQISIIITCSRSLGAKGVGKVVIACLREVETVTAVSRQRALKEYLEVPAASSLLLPTLGR